MVLINDHFFPQKTINITSIFLSYLVTEPGFKEKQIARQTSNYKRDFRNVNFINIDSIFIL